MIITLEDQITIENDFELKCNKCGNDLEATQDKYGEIWADPCETCLEELSKTIREEYEEN